jgi:hypothetical protein
LGFYFLFFYFLLFFFYFDKKRRRFFGSTFTTRSRFSRQSVALAVELPRSVECEHHKKARTQKLAAYASVFIRQKNTCSLGTFCE